MLSNFTFKKTGSGEYKVTYQKNIKYNSYYIYYTNDMPLIDSLLYSESIRKKDVTKLKKLCLQFGAKRLIK